MTYLNPLLITIASTPDGYYRWELHTGPDGAFDYSGSAPLLERVFEEIIRAQCVLSEDLDPENGWPPYPPPYDAPIPQVHPTAGTALPAQQDVPATHGESPTSIYPLPSDFG